MLLLGQYSKEAFTLFRKCTFITMKYKQTQQVFKQ